MPRILPIHLNAAVNHATGMSLVEKEAAFDVIYHEQPNLLASVIVQQQMGNSLEQMEVLLNLLLVVHLSMREAGITPATVTEEEQEHSLKRLVGMIKFSDNLDKESFDIALQQMIEGHPEKWLFAYAVHEMMRAEFPYLEKESSKYLLLCGLNLVNCL